MRFLKIFASVFLLLPFTATAQDLNAEKVQWDNPAVYSASLVHFQTNEVEMTMKNCRLLEIESASGVSGFYITGKGTITIAAENITVNISGFMLRCNPADLLSFLSVSDKKTVDDAGFVVQAMQVLKSMFRHCFHSGMDALIPDRKIYAINFLGAKYGDVLASNYEDKFLVYSFTEKRKL